MLDRTDKSIIGIWWWTVDKWILTSALLLIIIGGILIMAASPPVANAIRLPEDHFVWKQLIFSIPASFTIIFLSFLKNYQIRLISFLGLIVTFILMLSTLLIGPEAKGATRWISLGPLTIQPSEFSKPFFAIICAWLLSTWKKEKNFRGWIWATFLLLIIVGILIKQPDIGMSLIILLTWGVQIFLAGMPLLLVLFLMALTPLILLFVYKNVEHVEKRVDQFIEGNAFQIKKSIQSFENGGIFGVGPGDGTIKLNLPDAHADFIFSVAAEEYGVIVCLILIGIYSFFVLRGFKISINSNNLFSLLAISSLSLQFGVQAAIHMSSTLNLIPTKGMTLPFISYGGSSLLATSISIGFILALTRNINTVFKLEDERKIN